MSFGFRLRWRLEHGRAIAGLTDVANISLSPDLPSLELKVVQAASRTGGQGLDLRAEGFTSETEARAVGARVQSALLLASLRRGYGIVMTPRVPGGSFTNYAKSLVAEHWGVTVHDDVYGVFVYENPETAVFMMLGELELAMREPLEGTLESWREALRPGPCMAEGVFVSYDLFAHSRFESSSRARFLLLVMAIEALLRPESGPPDEVAVLDAAIGLIRQSSLAENRKTTLASRLGQLKKESIGSAARAYLDRAWAAGVLSIADAADVFQTSYGIRSGMVHRGITPGPAELADRSGQLETIIKELLVAVLEGKRA